MPRPSKTQTAVAEPPAQAFPSVSIIERRIQSGASNARKLAAFSLKGQPEPMAIRAFNCGITGRFYVATEELGWVPITPDEVAGGLHGTDIRAKDGHVVSGQNGEEVWMKMPSRLYHAVAKAKADRIDRQMQSKSALIGRTTKRMEDEAKQADKAGAESLERAAERLGDLEIDTLNVTREAEVIG